MAFPDSQIAWDIRRRGQLVKLIKIDDAPDSGQEIKAKLKPVELSDVDGDRVLEGDEVVQIIPDDVTGRAPEVGDEIVIDGSTISVNAVTTKKRRGSAIRYDLRIRR